MPLTERLHLVACREGREGGRAKEVGRDLEIPKDKSIQVSMLCKWSVRWFTDRPTGGDQASVSWSTMFLLSFIVLIGSKRGACFKEPEESNLPSHALFFRCLRILLIHCTEHEALVRPGVHDQVVRLGNRRRKPAITVFLSVTFQSF